VFYTVCYDSSTPARQASACCGCERSSSADDGACSAALNANAMSLHAPLHALR
jgi:hypothetical protein